MSGTPVTLTIGSKPDHLPPPNWANRVDNPSCVSSRTLIPHAFAASHAEKLSTVRTSENNTRGGSSETELNELTVVPTNRPSGARAVTTTTPVGKTPSAFRKSPGVKFILITTVLA